MLAISQQWVGKGYREVTRTMAYPLDGQSSIGEDQELIHIAKNDENILLVDPVLKILADQFGSELSCNRSRETASRLFLVLNNTHVQPFLNDEV